MKKVLFVAHIARHIESFHHPFLKMFQENGYVTYVATNFNKFQGEIKYADVKYNLPFARNPFNVSNFKAYKKLKQIIDTERFDIIHCHTPVGGVIARLAARKARKQGKTKVIYTAHGFHFYKGAPLLNWLLYFPVEWLCSFMTDTLITINKEDYAFAKKHLHAKQTEYVHGVGIDLEKFSKRISLEEREKLRAELCIKPDEKLLLSIGELTIRKNHETVVCALAKVKDNSFHYAIAGKGELAEYLRRLANENDVNVHLLGFRTDITKLCSVADLFVFPSRQEGLPVALMEAVACKTPIICSDIRGNNELVSEENLFTLGNIEQLSEMLKNGVSDMTVETNYKNLQKFSIENVMQEMKNIYGCENC